MTALLDLPAIRELVSPLSVAEYHRLGEFNENGRRTELVRGILLEKTSESPLHRFTAGLLRDILAAQIKPGFVLFSQDPLTTLDSEPEPDVMVVRGSPADFRTVHPSTAELVAEIAVTSLDIDRAKADVYAEAGVKEYWIVCPERGQVEVYRRPSLQGYGERTIATAPSVLDSLAFATPKPRTANRPGNEAARLRRAKTGGNVVSSVSQIKAGLPCRGGRRRSSSSRARCGF